ncbi:MAG: proteasome assembly chaperone family protein [Candidatus Altiarchaeota archaeon]
MDVIEVEFLEKPELKKAILIEGLPGIGLVGKLAADHMITELKAKLFARMYSPFLPPQVLIGDDGIIKMVSMDFYYSKGKKNDLIFLVGDFQGITPDSQYQISERIIDVFSEFDLKRIYTLGGLGTGVLTQTPRVFGAANQKKLVEETKKHGIIFKGGGAIFGASGLLLGLCNKKDLEAICLMGETHGQIIDARSAEAVLETLTKILGIKVDMKKLEAKAKETEEQMTKITKMISAHEKMLKHHTPEGSSEDLSYIR